MKVYSVEKAKYWRAKLEDQRISGISMSHYCKRNNLSLDSFKYWKYRFRDEDFEELTEINDSRAEYTAGRFLPVCVNNGYSVQRRTPSVKTEPSISPSGLSIRLGRSASLHIEEDFDSRLLGRVLEVISRL